MDPRSSSDNIHPTRGGRGIQEAQVWEAADVLLHEGLRPTIERVRQKIGSGSPNTVSPMLERWFATLGKRLEGPSASVANNGLANSEALRSRHCPLHHRAVDILLHADDLAVP